MRAVGEDRVVELLLGAKPAADQIREGAFQRADGLWVYRKLPARELWSRFIRSRNSTPGSAWS